MHHFVDGQVADTTTRLLPCYRILTLPIGRFPTSVHTDRFGQNRLDLFEYLIQSQLKSE